MNKLFNELYELEFEIKTLYQRKKKIIFEELGKIIKNKKYFRYGDSKDATIYTNLRIEEKNNSYQLYGDKVSNFTLEKTENSCVLFTYFDNHSPDFIIQRINDLIQCLLDEIPKDYKIEGFDFKKGACFNEFVEFLNQNVKDKSKLIEIGGYLAFNINGGREKILLSNEGFRMSLEELNTKMNTMYELNKDDEDKFYGDLIIKSIVTPSGEKFTKIGKILHPYNYHKVIVELEK